MNIIILKMYLRKISCEDVKCIEMVKHKALTTSFCHNDSQLKNLSVHMPFNIGAYKIHFSKG
jgi:hypothetical protein